MSSSGFLDVAAGLVLAFGIAAALASAATEGVARLCGLRGRYLLRGLGELLDGRPQESIHLGAAKDSYDAVKRMIIARGMPVDARVAADVELDNGQLRDAPLAAEAAQARRSKPMDRRVADAANPGSAVPAATSALLGSPILRNRGMAVENLTLEKPKPGRLPNLARKRGLWSQCRSLPSYIPPESFAEAVVDLVVPDATKEIKIDAVRDGVNALPTEMTAFKSSLQALVKNAGDDIIAFRKSVEHWFNNQMGHVSHEYKRDVAIITLAAGVLLVVLFNINALTIGRTLYSDVAIGNTVTSQTAKQTVCYRGEIPQECAVRLQVVLSAESQAQLPLGWTTVQRCLLHHPACTRWQQYGIFSIQGNPVVDAALFILGLVLTIVALLPGARFWFGLLGKLKNAFG